MVFKGYQTLEDRNNPEYFEQNGPHRCVSKKAWLGMGYYFWDSEILWAHKWGRDNYSDYMIFEGDITYNESVFDMYGNPTHRKDMKKWAELLQQKDSTLSEDTLTVYNVLEYAKRNAKFEDKYNTIRAADYPKTQMFIKFAMNRKEGTYLGVERVQFCLLNKKNLHSHSFIVVHPEEYRQF